MANSGERLLILQGVSKRFGGLLALNNVSLQVNRGEIVGVIGPNGSGKTTLFATITGFLLAESGQIVFDGRSISGLQPFRICQLGIVRTFQLTQPFSGLTALENVLIGALHGGRPVRQAQNLALEILSFVGLADKASQRADELTIADLKRLELARALATQPKLLLLDEIMAGLRPGEVDLAVTLIRQIQQRGVTLIVVEHLMRAVMALSDRLYVLHHGSLIAEGEPEQVIHRPEVVDAYFGEHIVDT
jgi:branched-chain amino acid transport system ATP-binding protein